MQLHVTLANCQARTSLLGVSRGLLAVLLPAVSARPPDLLLTCINLQRVLRAQERCNNVHKQHMHSRVLQIEVPKAPHGAQDLQLLE